MGYRLKGPRNTAALNYPANSDPYGGRLPSWNVIAQHITSAKAKEAALRLDTHGIRIPYHTSHDPLRQEFHHRRGGEQNEKFGDARSWNPQIAGSWNIRV